MRKKGSTMKARNVVTALLHWRKVHGYSQEVMANLIGYQAKQQYGEVELGKRYPKIPTLVKILRITGLTLEDLYPELYKEGM